MSEAALRTGQTARSVDQSFLWRRLHSLSGVIPIGGFLCFHIFENLAALRGPAAYDEMVHSVNTLLPRMYFLGVELGMIVIPLLFHSLYGIYIAATGQPNVGQYAYGSNWAYWAQRFTGYIAFIYVFVHMGVLRVWVTLLGNHLVPTPEVEAGGHSIVTYTDVAAHLGNTQHLTQSSALAGTHIFILYLIGTVATIYHFTNGLNGFAWTWGIAVGRVAQRRVRVVAWVLFVALAAATLNILFKMRWGGPA